MLNVERIRFRHAVSCFTALAIISGYSMATAQEQTPASASQSPYTVVQKFAYPGDGPNKIMVRETLANGNQSERRASRNEVQYYNSEKAKDPTIQVLDITDKVEQYDWDWASGFGKSKTDSSGGLNLDLPQDNAEAPDGFETRFESYSSKNTWQSLDKASDEPSKEASTESQSRFLLEDAMDLPRGSLPENGKKCETIDDGFGNVTTSCRGSYSWSSSSKKD